MSAKYRSLRVEIARLKAEASKLKRQMRKAEVDAEDKLVRDELMEVEELFAATANNPGVIRASDGFDIDFSEAYYPRLGHGPVPFWGGSYADDPVVASESDSFGQLLDSFLPAVPERPSAPDGGASFVGSPVLEQDRRNG